MRFLTTLYVLGHGTRVSVSKGSLLVARREGERTRVPINAVESVVLAGYAQMSTEALDLCTRRRIRVAALRKNGRVRFVLGAPIQGNVHLRLAQYRTAHDEQQATLIARHVVAGKLQNCRRLLLKWAENAGELERSVLRRNAEHIADRIEALADARDRDVIRGFEGDGTRRYFRGLATHLSAAHEVLRFTSRSRRPPADPPNALLSFLYGLLLVEIVGALDALGLDPQVGYLHGVRPGRPSLALDLIEELRPAVADRLAARLLRRGQLGPDAFEATLGDACYLSDTGKRRVFEEWDAYRAEEVRHAVLDQVVPRASIPVVQATLLARHLRGDVPAYVPYVLDR